MEVVINDEYTFELFVCLAILHRYRSEVMACPEACGLYQVINGYVLYVLYVRVAPRVAWHACRTVIYLQLYTICTHSTVLFPVIMFHCAHDHIHISLCF